MNLHQNFRALGAFMAISFVFTIVVSVSYYAFAASHGWRLSELTSLIAFMLLFAWVVISLGYLPSIREDLDYAAVVQSILLEMLDSLNNPDNRQHEQFVFSAIVEKIGPHLQCCSGIFAGMNVQMQANFLAYIDNCIAEEKQPPKKTMSYVAQQKKADKILYLEHLARILRNPERTSAASEWQQSLSEIR